MLELVWIAFSIYLCTLAKLNGTDHVIGTCTYSIEIYCSFIATHIIAYKLTIKKAVSLRIAGIEV